MDSNERGDLISSDLSGDFSVWILIRANDEEDFFFIQNNSNGLALKGDSNGMASLTKLKRQDLSQQWEISEEKKIINRVSQLYLSFIKKTNTFLLKKEIQKPEEEPYQNWKKSQIDIIKTFNKLS